MVKEEKYIEYKVEGRLYCKTKYKNEHPEFNSKDDIYKDFKKRFEISDKEYENFEKKYSDIPVIMKKCTTEREEGFGSRLDFYKWYKRQDRKCGYCSISEDILEKLFESKHLISKKFTATLHIERKTPNGGYNEENCILACSLCNNAKSDLINEENYRKYFAKSMNEFLKDLGDGLIENKC